MGNPPPVFAENPMDRGNTGPQSSWVMKIRHDWVDWRAILKG